MPCLPTLGNKRSVLKKFFIKISQNENVENLWTTINTIMTNQYLKKSIVGNLKNISELRNGTILIETENHIQSNKIVQIETLAGTQGL